MAEASDARVVSGRILTLPRLTALVAAGLLVSATISLAADKPTVRAPAAHKAMQRQVMVVPDVRSQLFVFASGILEDGGFGWKVRGFVGGFPANVVAFHSKRVDGNFQTLYAGPSAQFLDWTAFRVKKT